MVSSRHCQLVEDDLFRELADQIEPDAKRLDEILEGVTWAISQDPSSGEQVPGTHLHVQITDPFPEAPSLLIGYLIEEDECTLCWIEEARITAEEDFSE